MNRTIRPVVDNEAQHRFETSIDGEAIAAAYYRIDDNARVVLIHTEVPSEYGGQGFATALATGVSDLVRQAGRKVVLSCSFMADFYRKHPEYADIVDG